MNILMLYGFAPHTTANYLARAFRALGHDVRSAGSPGDLRGWANPYRLWGPHDYPLADGQRLDTGDWKPDLAVWVESGTMDIRPLEGVNAPTAAWFIDSQNPAKLAWHQSVAPLFDHVFCAVLPASEKLPNAHWLPLACDPEIHTPRPGIVQQYDIAYVGNQYGDGIYTRRFETLYKLAQRYNTRFVSGVYFEDMADVYASARMGWNMSLTGGDLVMRVFEVMCSGRPLVMDHAVASGFEQLQWGADGFERDTGAGLSIPIWTYENEGEMYEEIDWLLSVDHSVRDAIGAAGRATVLAAHTYAHRGRELLAVCNA
jgi:hypothetical protein